MISLAIQSTRLLYLAFLCCVFCAQTYSQSYFQQKVDYDITVRLDTVGQKIEGTCQLSYKNNSPDRLDHIIFHAWWNAYKDNSTAFAAQQLELGNRSFYFAKEDKRGGYEKLEFRDDYNALVTKSYRQGNRIHKDIIKVILDEPLESGKTLDLTIDFIVKLPAVFSRGGYKDDLYQMTQWYPKPAVYDNEGWHPMPYVDIGEFYSEYGDYKVELLLPSSFKHAATGIVQSEEQEGGEKLVQYAATNVPDFAWFASETFVAETKSITLDDGKEVSMHLLTNFETGRDELMNYMSDALKFYSKELGSYPYPQYSLVLDNSAYRGGMEYPMISMVDLDDLGQNMDNLIAHEIGHNWFQSALGTNERRYPWLDEGLNSFYERKYNDSKYPVANFDNIIPKFLKSDSPEYTALQAGVCHLHCCGKLGRIDQHSEEVDMITYGSNSYERMAFALQYLEGYLGEEIFATAMQQYYSQWLHKHPGPADLKQSFQSLVGNDLSWFFDELITQGKKYDYKLVGVEEDGELLNVSVANATDFKIPFHITAYDADGTIIHNKWVGTAEQSQVIAIPNAPYDHITINGEIPFEDINRKNNHIRPGKALLKRAPINLKWLGQQRDSDTKTLLWTPYAGYNNYDGLMLGLAMYNSFFPYNDLRWYVAPSFGIRGGELAGSGAIEKDFRGKGSGPIWTVGMQARKYLYDSGSVLSSDLSYTKLVPTVRLTFRSKGVQHRTLDYKLHHLKIEDFCPDLCLPSYTRSNVHQINYRTSTARRLSQMNSLVQLEYESYNNVFNDKHSYLKLSLEHNRSIYYTKGSKFHLRFFGGYFPMNSQRGSANYSDGITRGSFALAQTGNTDHTYEGYYLGRSEQEGGLAKQFQMAEGGFKNPLSNLNANTLSNNYMAALNVKVDVPFSILGTRFRPFVDLAYLSNKSQLSEELSGQFYYAGGLAFEIGEFAGIYLTLVNSEEFLLGDFSDRISFKVDINRLNFWRMAENPISVLR